jgi:hypothetical protein
MSSGTPATCTPAPGRSRFILALVCAASVLGAVSASAQGTEVTRTSEHNKDQTLSDVNPCNGQPVIGQGHSTVRSTEKSSASGSDFTFHVFENGQLTADGNSTERYQYTFSNSSRFRSSTPNFTFTLQTRKHIVREGRAAGQTRDSYFQYDKFTFSTATPPSSEKVKVDCK